MILRKKLKQNARIHSITDVLLNTYSIFKAVKRHLMIFVFRLFKQLSLFLTLNQVLIATMIICKFTMETLHRLSK